MRNALFLAMTALAAATAAYAGDYKVTVPLSPDEEGAMAYLVNYDTGVNIDSVLVEDTTAVFCGRVDVPILARVIVDGNRRGQFILEDGTYTFRRGQTIHTGSKSASACRQRRGRANGHIQGGDGTPGFGDACKYR